MPCIENMQTSLVGFEQVILNNTPPLLFDSFTTKVGGRKNKGSNWTNMKNLKGLRNMSINRLTEKLILITLFTTLTSFLYAEDKAIIVFDASGSMWSKIDGKTKIKVAKETLENLVNNWDEKKTLGLLAYGHRTKGDCNDIQTLIPIGKVDKKQMISIVNKINPKGKTPISAAIKKAAEELKFTEDNATVILISDGKETCNADPCKTAAELEKLGVNFTAHVIGFDVDEETGKQLKCIATNTGGQYFPADNAEQLNEALVKVAKQLTALTIKAIDENGNELNNEIEWVIINQDTEEVKLLNGEGTGASLTIVDAEGNEKLKDNSTIFSGKWLISGSSGSLSGEKMIDIYGDENQIIKVKMKKSNSGEIAKQDTDKPVTLDKTVFMVEANTVESIVIDGVEEESKYEAKYELGAELVLLKETVTLNLSPKVKSYSEGLETLPDPIPGNWGRAYTLNGELKKLWGSNDSVFFNHETLGIFTIRDLLLYIPKNKLRIDGKWNKDILTHASPITVEVIVTALSDTEIEIEYYSLPLSDSQNDKIYLRSNLQGKAVYDRQTLLIKTAKIIEKSKLLDKVTKNLQKVKLLSEKSSVITISRSK